MMQMKSSLVLNAIKVVGLFLVSAAPIQTIAQETNQSELAIERGKQRFEMNCSLCHGKRARGFGPFVSQLNKKPPDLTRLNQRNNGSFPFRRIYEAIDGRSFPDAHGSRGMPIWGEAFKGTVAGHSETLVQGRILELLLYLESIQVE